MEFCGLPVNLEVEEAWPHVLHNPGQSQLKRNIIPGMNAANHRMPNNGRHSPIRKQRIFLFLYNTFIFKDLYSLSYFCFNDNHPAAVFMLKFPRSVNI